MNIILESCPKVLLCPSPLNEWFDEWLNNQTRVYTNGERVTGKLVVACDKPGENINRLYILCTGTVEVSWNAWPGWRHRHLRRTRRIPIRGSLTFWNVEEPLRESRNAVVHLPEGESVFHFDIPLPENLVTSCKLEHGYVQYKIKAVATRPWYTFDSTTEQILTVLAKVPVDSFPDASHRVEEKAWKTFCYCCFETERLNLRATLPKKGYCVGETIMLNVEIDNQSGRTVDYVSAKLLQIITFSGNEQWLIGSGMRMTMTKETSETISFQKIEHFPVEGGQIKSINAEIFVPEILPSGLGMQTIIDVKYFVRVEAHVAWYATNLILDVPVLIGTTR